MDDFLQRILESLRRFQQEVNSIQGTSLSDSEELTIPEGGDKEVWEIEKHGVKTRISVIFDNRGHPANCEIIVVGKEAEKKDRIKLLKRDLNAKIKEQNFEEAAKIRDEIKKLEEDNPQ